MSQRLGPYVLTRELARGGQGVVWEAEQADFGHHVAIKVLLDRDPKTVARFRQEGLILARLGHPNLLRVVDLGEHEGQPYLVTEFIVGEDLSRMVKSGGLLSPPGVASILLDVASALAHCHEHGVIHRDLKPANVLIEAGSGRPVLVDFGLAKRDAERFASLDEAGLSRLSVTGEAKGTPAYMPPEQADESIAAVGPHSDVYSLGATLFYLLTGTTPYSGATFFNVLAKLLSDDPPPDPREREPSVPPRLAVLCLHTMQKDPAQRPSLGDVSRELRAFVDGQGPTFGPPPAPRRDSRGPLWLGAGLLALAPLAGAGWYVTRPARQVPPEAPPSVARALPPESPSDSVDASAELDRISVHGNLSIRADRLFDWLDTNPGHERTDDAWRLLEALSPLGQVQPEVGITGDYPFGLFDDSLPRRGPGRDVFRTFRSLAAPVRSNVAENATPLAFDPRGRWVLLKIGKAPGFVAYDPLLGRQRSIPHLVVTGGTFSPDGRHALVSTAREVHVFDADSWVPVARAAAPFLPGRVAITDQGWIVVSRRTRRDFVTRIPAETEIASWQLGAEGLEPLPKRSVPVYVSSLEASPARVFAFAWAPNMLPASEVEKLRARPLCEITPSSVKLYEGFLPEDHLLASATVRGDLLVTLSTNAPRDEAFTGSRTIHSHLIYWDVAKGERLMEEAPGTTAFAVSPRARYLIVPTTSFGHEPTLRLLPRKAREVALR